MLPAANGEHFVDLTEREAIALEYELSNHSLPARELRETTRAERDMNSSHSSCALCASVKNPQTELRHCNNISHPSLEINQ
jgi:serine phosphatase RsbU (regulator of sigma subunit)